MLSARVRITCFIYIFIHTHTYICALLICLSHSVISTGDEDLFKIKKPSFNEVTFRIQKKKSLLPAQREAEESKSKYFHC